MKATYPAAGLIVLVALLHIAGAVTFGPIAWTVLAVALASGLAVDLVRARTGVAP